MSAPVIHGTEATGWRTVFDYATGIGTTRVRVSMGPYASVDTQRTALIAALVGIETLDVSVSPGSALATIRCTYGTSDTLPLNERRWPVYAIYPCMVCVDLKAHPELDSIAVDMPEIDTLIAQGDIDAISSTYASNALALKYARLVLAGVSAYESPAFTLAVTRYYTSAPSIASDYAKINQVFAWGSISTDGKSIPATVNAPKYIMPGGTATSYEWRLVSVAPVIQRSETNTVQWQYIGLERWAKWLYSGGTWEPDSL